MTRASGSRRRLVASRAGGARVRVALHRRDRGRRARLQDRPRLREQGRAGASSTRPGSTNFFAPFIRDFYTLRHQGAEPARWWSSARAGDREARDDLQFKTTDGNDISMDVTVVWQIDPEARADAARRRWAPRPTRSRRSWCGPMARTLRARRAQRARQRVGLQRRQALREGREGARGAAGGAGAATASSSPQVILHEHRFNPEYERSSTTASWPSSTPSSSRARREAAAQEALRNLETARGKVAADIAAADGRARAGQARAPTPTTSRSSRTPRRSSPSAPPRRRRSRATEAPRGRDAVLTGASTARHLGETWTAPPAASVSAKR